MAAQAKPSCLFDSSETIGSGGGSLNMPMFSDPVPGAGGAGGGVAASSAGTATGGLAGAVSVVRQPLGLYLHVPFCSSTCDFCAFYQQKPHKPSIDLFIDAVAAELARVRAEIELGLPWVWQGEAGYPAAGGTAHLRSAGSAGGTARLHGAGSAGETACLHGAGSAGGMQPLSGEYTFTVFFGGGTPGLLAARDLARLCELVRGALEGLGPILEWSIELAPATVQADKVKALLEHGVTRFSLGVQSFSEELLDALGRQHSPRQVLAAYETLRRGGAGNINCDLMFALPGQTREDWLADLEKMRSLNPEHISTYCLTFEEDTAMWVKLAKGRYKLDPEREAALYRETWAWLDAAGYKQYEVSNFAREGFRSRHNLATWQMSRWRGVGPSAASQWGGWRFQNPANLEAWAKAQLGGSPEFTAATTAAARVRRSQSSGDGCASTQSAVGGDFSTISKIPIHPADAEDCSCATEASPDTAARVSDVAAGAGSNAVADGSGTVQGSLCAAAGSNSAAAAGGLLPEACWPPSGSEQQVGLSNALLAADALIFGLRRRDGVDRAQWLARFLPAAGAMGGAQAAGSGEVAVDLPLRELDALFARFAAEGLLDESAQGCWRLSDEGLLLADAVGSAILECFDSEEAE